MTYDYSRTRRFDELESENDLTKDVAFNRKSFGMDSHVSPYDNGTVQVGVDGIEVVLIQGIDERSLHTVLTAAERATLGWDMGELDYLGRQHFDPDQGNEMFKGGLQTALESQVVVFGVKGASRTATHQIVRARKAAFHQQSQRASYMGDRPEVRMPDSIWNAPYEVRKAWFEAVEARARAYRMATVADVSYQDARFILPEGTTNFIMMEYPIREFINVYNYRGCSMFQWEIVHIMREARRLLVELHPWIEPYIKISCERTHGHIDGAEPGRRYGGNPELETEARAHTCTFQGWEEVEHQCPLPWARESNRQFKSERHSIKEQK